MSYRNPARIVDTQSGQHFRNMQQSLAKSFQGVIDQDTARIKAGMVKAEKEQAALRKKLQTQEDEAYRSALQASQQTNTSVRYDNMQDNLAYNAYLAGRPAGSLTPEERTWQQNFRNVGSSIKNVLANIVSGREDYEKAKSIRPGQEGSIAATVDNVNKQKAYEIFLNGNGGTSHAYFDGTTGETTVIAKDLDGIVVGRVTSKGDMYEFATVVVTDKDREANVKTLLTSIKNESISSPIYGENPASTPVKDSSGNTTSYFLKPVKENVIEALYTPSLATVQSWTPDQQMNWYNSTQKGKKDFLAIPAEKIWTEDEKYVEKEVLSDPSDPNSKKVIKTVPNEYVVRIAKALASKTFDDNSMDLMQNRFFGKEKIKELEDKKSSAEIKAEKARKDKKTAYNTAKKFMDENKDDLSLKGGISGYSIEGQMKKIINYAGNEAIGVDVRTLKIGEEEKPSSIQIKGPGGTFVYGAGSTNEQIRSAILKAAVKNPDVSDNKESNNNSDASRFNKQK